MTVPPTTRGDRPVVSRLGLGCTRRSELSGAGASDESISVATVRGQSAARS